MTDLYVIGMGPGSRAGMTIEAREAILASQYIAGYTTYVNLLREQFSHEELSGKEIVNTGMRQEEERCRLAIKRAAEGITTAVICSGDSQVYGMAGLILEMTDAEADVNTIIVPGVSAVLSGSAILGAAVGHDFAVISLSDLLTPWEIIEKRLKAAGEGDFVICLYNPSSRQRSDYLDKACKILLESKPETTICGYVRNIGRKGEESGIMTLKELQCFEADMFTTVFIGNRDTVNINGRMVTPRGYGNKRTV